MNIHVVRLDVYMIRQDWDLVKDKDTVLEAGCKPKKQKTLDAVTGVAEDANATFYRGQPAYRVTFNMFSTNIPAEAPVAMAGIKCIRLRANPGYGWTGYYSDSISISR